MARRQNYTIQERAIIFEKLAWNCGNISRTAKEVGLDRKSIYIMLRDHLDEFEEHKKAVRDATLLEAVELRRLAMETMKEVLLVYREKMRHPQHRFNCRPRDVAQAVDKIDKIVRLDNGESTENIGVTTIEERIKAQKRKRGLIDADGKPIKRPTTAVH